VAQGIANIASPLFGGIPATGAIARTATNIRSGGRTPIAGLIHALTLLLIMLLFGKWAGMIPLATLAAILVMVAYNMSEWRTFRAMLKYPRSDVIVLLTTSILTVAIDLTVAIEAGMVLAAFLFMRRMAAVTNVSVIGREVEDSDEPDSPLKLSLPKGVQIYEINGPFFFGAAEKFSEAVLADQQFPQILIIRMRNVPAIDATGIRAIEDILRRTRNQKAAMLLCEIAPQPLGAMEKAGLLTNLGSANISSTLDEALEQARRIVKP
jgi:sulfate permease, SulP family